ncbi:MAG: mechanosensitive ion channel domain-containing protein, partial [Caulobacteraceae bacterium]
WRDFAYAVPSDAERLIEAAGREQGRLGAAFKGAGGSVALALGVLVAAFLLWPARAGLARLGYARAEAGGEAGSLRKTSLALWLTLAGVLPPLGAGLILRGVLAGAGALTPTFDQIATLAIRMVAWGFLLESLGRVLLSPRRPRWRLAPIPDDVVARLAAWPALLGVTGALGVLAGGLDTILGVGLATAVAGDCLVVVLEMVSVGGALTMLARARNARLAAVGRAGRGTRAPWILAVLAAWIALATAFVALLAGYLALAIFVMRETIWIGIVLAVLFLLLRFFDDLFPALFAPTRPIGRLLRGGVGVSSHALEHLAVLVSGLFRLLLLLIAWSAILMPFGASFGDIVGRIASPNVAFHIGAVPISPGAILGGIGIFLVGLMVTRAVRGWLESRYLPKTKLDIGARTSLAAAVTYVGAAIAVVLAFSYLGLNFSQIALVASALSVGIGFGLQSIIGNFVSGLILLAERPVKVGDWIAIGDLQGNVRRINIRATEIEMFDRSSLIVPNSDLISKTVRNLTHSGAVGRLTLVLKIRADADPAAVRETLAAQVAAHPEVLNEPPPAIYLSDARDGALEFTLFAFVASARVAYRVKSELLFAILPALKARDVSLYSASTIVNVSLKDDAAEPWPAKPPDA